MAIGYRAKILLIATTAVSFIVSNPTLAHAQQTSPTTNSLTFEVATVKPTDITKPVMLEMRVYPGGRLVIHAYTLRALILSAFDLSPAQLAGRNKLLDERFFDIEGKPSEALRAQMTEGEYSSFVIKEPKVRVMLQNLLIERFHLKFHMETMSGTVYRLERGNGPLRLTPVSVNLYKRSEDGTVSPGNNYPTGEVSPKGLYQASMKELARALSMIRHAPVNDETGLQGFYNFRSKTSVANEDYTNGDAASLITEMLPEMGLRLVKTEGPVEKMVIDSVAPPTEN